MEAACFFMRDRLVEWYPHISLKSVLFFGRIFITKYRPEEHTVTNERDKNTDHLELVRVVGRINHPPHARMMLTANMIAVQILRKTSRFMLFSPYCRADPFALLYLYFLYLRKFVQQFRSEMHLFFLKQQDDGRTGKLKMPFLHAFAKTGIFLFVEDAADYQCTDLALHHRSKVFCCHQTPAALVQHEYRVGFAGNGLNAVKDTGNKMVFALVTIINVTIVVVV